MFEILTRPLKRCFCLCRHIAFFRKSVSLTVRRSLKRALDIGIAAMSLILLSPLFLMVAIAIKLDSNGPVLIRVRQYGLNGKVIAALKFRFTHVLEHGAQTMRTPQDDDPVTPLGRVLRRTELDDLPQLLTVLVGDMSIVGPEAVSRGEIIEDVMISLPRRQTFKPGITGWAQVHGCRQGLETYQDTMSCQEYHRAIAFQKRARSLTR
jgi:lipopolysaccharide/colanic/teichoic acid biosynthesis glycosyltransferase